MSKKITAEMLQGLRRKRNLSQEDLVRITIEKRQKISLSTIKRIEDPKQPRRALNPRTIRVLAAALDVTAEELTGVDLTTNDEQEHLSTYIPIKDKIDRKTDLSYQAVEAIYGISRSAQIAMAPLFSALLAEASLKWRKERLEALSSIGDQLDSIRGDNPLLKGAFFRTWEAEKIEKTSIEQRDVLGHSAIKFLAEKNESAYSGLDSDCDTDLYNSNFTDEWYSPFLLFLQDYATSLQQPDIKLDLRDGDSNSKLPNGIADYRVGADFIDEICGDNEWAKIAIEFGHVALADIPKELLPPERTVERLAYLTSQITDEMKWQHAQSIVEMTTSALERTRQARPDDDRFTKMWGKEPFAVTDELIKAQLECLNGRRR